MQNTWSEAYHQSKNLFWLTVAFAGLIAIPLVVAIAIDHPAARWSGGIVAIVIAFGYVAELIKQIALFGIYAGEREANTGRIKAEIARIHSDGAPASKPVVTIINSKRNDEGGFSAQRNEYPNPPSWEFIEWVSREASDASIQGKGQRVPTERDGERSMYAPTFDQWMTALQEQGVVEWVNEANPKLGRQWVRGVTLDDALARFGYNTTPLPGEV